jgi:hypothetical protein
VRLEPQPARRHLDNVAVPCEERLAGGWDRDEMTPQVASQSDALLAWLQGVEQEAVMWTATPGKPRSRIALDAEGRILDEDPPGAVLGLCGEEGVHQDVLLQPVRSFWGQHGVVAGSEVVLTELKRVSASCDNYYFDNSPSVCQPCFVKALSHMSPVILSLESIVRRI